KGVPAAGPTEPFQFEVRLAPVAVRQRPTPILALAAAENLDRLGEARVARRVDNLEIIESAEDVVVPPRREREAKEDWLDDFASAVGAKEAVHEQEFTTAALCILHRLHFVPTVRLIKPQTLQDADGGMNRSMRRAIASLAVPPTVRHLLREQVVGQSVEPVVVVLEARENGEYHASDAGLASPAPSVVDAAIALQSSVQKQRAGPARLPVGRGQTKVPQPQHRGSRGRPLRGVQSAVRRQPARPGARPILPGEETGAPTLARDLAPLPLDAAFGGPNQLPQRLPADGRISIEEPLNGLIALQCRIHSRSVDCRFRTLGSTAQAMSCAASCESCRGARKPRHTSKYRKRWSLFGC